MSRKNRLAAMAEAKAEGRRVGRKASGRSLKTLSQEELEELATKGRNKIKGKGKGLANALRAELLRSDDWQAVGQRKRDLIEGHKRFNESEAAALLKTRPYRKSDERFSEYTWDKYRR
jgi:hypothetical protein